MPDDIASTAATVRDAIAAEVRAELARQRRSQRDIGLVLGLPQSSINLRLKGDTSFRGEELVMLAAELDVPVSQLLPAMQPAPAVAA